MLPFFKIPTDFVIILLVILWKYHGVYLTACSVLSVKRETSNEKSYWMSLDSSDIVGLICFPLMYWTPIDGVFLSDCQFESRLSKRANLSLNEKMGGGRGKVSGEEV